MAQETQEIDIRMWCIRILKNWYWILLSCILFGAWGVYTYLSTTPRHTVDAKIMIRTSDSDSPLPQMEMLAMMGMGGMSGMPSGGFPSGGSMPSGGGMPGGMPSGMPSGGGMPGGMGGSRGGGFGG